MKGIIKKWVYINKRSQKILDTWEGDVESICSRADIGDGILDVYLSGWWEDEYVAVYSTDSSYYGIRSPASLKRGLCCSCDSHDLFWFGCRCGFMAK